MHELTIPPVCMGVSCNSAVCESESKGKYLEFIYLCRHSYVHDKTISSFDMQGQDMNDDPEMRKKQQRFYDPLSSVKCY